MNKLLTTGEMLNKIKTGEKERSGIGASVWMGNTGALHDVKEGCVVECDEHFLNQIWEIQPNYVSFNKAMKALKDGSVITWHDDEGPCITFCEADKVELVGKDYAGLTFNDFCFGKWTVEGDAE